MKHRAFAVNSFAEAVRLFNAISQAVRRAAKSIQHVLHVLHAEFCRPSILSALGGSRVLI